MMKVVALTPFEFLTIYLAISQKVYVSRKFSCFIVGINLSISTGVFGALDGQVPCVNRFLFQNALANNIERCAVGIRKTGAVNLLTPIFQNPICFRCVIHKRILSRIMQKVKNLFSPNPVHRIYGQFLTTPDDNPVCPEMDA